MATLRRGQEPYRHRGVADLDLAAVVERGLLHLVAVDEHPVGGPEVDHADVGAGAVVGVHSDLCVPARDARVVDPQVRLGAAADHDAGRVERVLHPVDLEDHGGAPYGGVGDGPFGDRRDLGQRGAAHPEPAGGQVVALVEADRHRAGEDVGLLVRVVAEHLGELLRQRGGVRREALVVLAGELDVELVGHQPPVAGQDLRGVVDLALEGGGDLHRLHGAAEGLGEHPADHLLETVLELLQDSHAALLSLLVSGVPTPVSGMPNPGASPVSMTASRAEQAGAHRWAGPTYWHRNGPVAAGFARTYRARGPVWAASGAWDTLSGLH